MISDSLLDNMERKLSELQSRSKHHDSSLANFQPTPHNGVLSSPATPSSARRMPPGSAVGADSTKKYTELQKQMDQMLGMVRNESENVRNLENQIYSNPTVGSAPTGVKMFDSSPNTGNGQTNVSTGPLIASSGASARQAPIDFEKQLSSLLTRSRGGSGNVDPRDNTEIKGELEGVIAGLSDYLNHMRHDLERYRKENEKLKMQLAEQMSKMGNIESEKRTLMADNNKLEKVQDSARELMFKLQNSDSTNAELRKELSKYPDLATLEQLKHSEKELYALKSSIAQFKDEMNAERESLGAQLRNEKQKLEEMQRKLLEHERREKELSQTQIQLASTQTSNDLLKVQVADLKQDLKQQQQVSMKSEDLMRHIQELTLNIDQQSGEIRPYHDHDISGKALGDFQKALNSKFTENKHAIDNLKGMIDSLKRDLKDVEDDLREEQENHRKSKEHAQLQRAQDKNHYDEKKKQWQDEVRKVKDKADGEREHFHQELLRLESEKCELNRQYRDMQKEHYKNEGTARESCDRFKKEVAQLKELANQKKDEYDLQKSSFEKREHDYEAKLNERERKMMDLEKTCSHLERELTKGQLEKEQLERRIMELNHSLEQEQRMCEKHQDSIEILKNEESRYKSIVRTQKDDIAKLSQLFEKALEGGLHNEDITRLNNEISNLQSFIAGQDETIRKLTDDLRRAEVSAQQPRFIKDSETGDIVRSDDLTSGLFCNVIQHHKQEDYIAALKARLQKVSKSKNVDSNLRRQTKELDNVSAQLEASKAELDQIEEKHNSVSKKYKTIVEKVEMFQRALVGVGSNPNETSEYFSGKGSFTLPRDVAEALKKHSQVSDDLGFLDQMLNERKQELTIVEQRLKEAESESVTVEEKTKGVMKVYSETKKQLSKSQTQAKKLLEQMAVTSQELKQASAALNTLQAEVELAEKKKQESENDLKDINKIIAKKNFEYQAVEQKRLKAKESADDIRSTEDELFGHLKASEKALIDRKNELKMLQSQTEEEARHVQEIEAEFIRKKSELQAVKNELSAKQSELTAVLKEAEDDMNRKSRELKDSKADLNNLHIEMNEYDTLKARKKRELNELRESVAIEEQNLANLKDSILTSSQELKQLREMVTSEKGNLDSLRNERSDILHRATDLESF